MIPRLAVAVLGLVAATCAAPAARSAEFYEGKTLTVIVGYAPGGGVDASARAMTRHIGRFIPGQPHIVVQNMEGAAGLVSVNHLDRRVAPDGLTLAVPGRSWYIEGVIKRPGVSFDPVKLTYIGSPGALTSAAFVRTSTGIMNFEQLKASPRTLTFGALGAGTPTAMAPALLASNGVPIKTVLGYVSTARVLLALEQGEVDGFFTVGNALNARTDLAAKVIPVVQSGMTAGRAGIPLLRDVIRPSQLAVLDLIMAPDGFGVPLVGPAGMPPQATDLLRRAFVAMAADKDYQADALKVELPVEHPLDGATLAEMMRKLGAATTPDVVAEFTRLSASR